MRILLSLIGCMLFLHANAQQVDKQLYLKLEYSPNRVYTERAVETIEAVSKISQKTTVDYRAGRSITLQPGFTASKGATFKAEIQSVSENTLRLTAFPNPFDQSTTIRFNLPDSGNITLLVVDSQGRIVERLLEHAPQKAGYHEIEWRAETLPPGSYIPILKTEKQQISSRIIKK